jgi:hypothetical protein
MISVVDSTSRTERAVVVVMMECIAVMPVPIMCPTVMCVPPSRPVAPIPGTMPCKPKITPEPIIDNRSIHIYRLDDIVVTIDVLIAHYLNGYIVRSLIPDDIDRRYVLIDIFRKDRLQNDQTLVAFSGLYYAQVVHLSVAVQVQITERAVGVV